MSFQDLHTVVLVITQHWENTLSICLDICLLQPLPQVAWESSVVSQD